MANPSRGGKGASATPNVPTPTPIGNTSPNPAIGGGGAKTELSDALGAFQGVRDMVEPYIEISKLKHFFNFVLATITGFAVAIGLVLGLESYGASQFGSGAQIALQAIGTYEQHYTESREAADRTTKNIEDLRAEISALAKRFDEFATQERQRE